MVKGFGMVAGQRYRRMHHAPTTSLGAVWTLLRPSPNPYVTSALYINRLTVLRCDCVDALSWGVHYGK